MKKYLLLALLPLLGGCVKIYEHAEHADNYMRDELLKINGHIISYFDGNKVHAREVAAAKPAPNIQPSYCYKTWGKVDCYTEELKGAHSRLTGFKGPAPVDAYLDKDFAAGNRDEYGNINTLTDQGWVTGNQSNDIQVGGSSTASPVIKSRLHEADVYAYERGQPKPELKPLPKQEVPEPMPIKTRMNY